MLSRMGASATHGAESDSPPAAKPKVTLIILRHGYSQFNAENRFTGWADVELSNRGREEARFAGSLLREAGVTRLERVYTSFLKRAIKTAWLMLDELELQWTPIAYSWRLNERHYGALQGQPKRLCTEVHGVKQVQKWRRGINHSPPGWDKELRSATVDRRYEGVSVPDTESLADCVARLQPFLNDELKPAMRHAIEQAEARKKGGEQGGGGADEADHQADEERSLGRRAGRHVPSFVIASSENLIRALVTELDGVAPADVPLLDIPYATPLVYEFDEDLNPIPTRLAVHPLRYGYYLGDADRIAEQQQRIRDAVVCEPTDEICNAFVQDDCFIMDEDSGPGEARWGCDEGSSESTDLS